MMVNIKRVPFGILFFFIVSCSFWKSKEVGDKLLPEESVQSHLEHLRVQGENYKSNGDFKVRPFNSRQSRYLKKILKKVINKSNKFFENRYELRDLKFFLVDAKKPFYFSLPSNEIFISTGILEKYVEHELNLLSILTYELVRITLKTYPVNYKIPTGYITTPQIISMIRIPPKDKVELHKWALYLIERSGFDENSYLIWIQTMNRNFQDFALYSGDQNTIFYEESQIKDFVVKNYSNKLNLAVNFNSSKEFYTFKAIFK